MRMIENKIDKDNNDNNNDNVIIDIDFLSIKKKE